MASRTLPLTFLFAAVASATANANGCTDDATTTAPCQTTNQLHLSLAMGAGFRSNPLYGGHNIPLWLMPDIAYYGQRWFFDNGTLGYSWALSPTLNLSVVSRFNDEQGYFQRTSFSNVFSSQRIADDGLAGPIQTLSPDTSQSGIDIGSVSKRPWALDGGLQLDWQQEHWQARFNWWRDISNEYKGSHAKAAIAYHFSHRTGDWGLSTAVAWKSANLLNRYYGLSLEDGGNPDTAVSGWQPEVGLHWTYALDEKWSLLSLYRYRWLNINVRNELDPKAPTTQSPFLAESFVRSWFIGVSYRFY